MTPTQLDAEVAWNAAIDALHKRVDDEYVGMLPLLTVGPDFGRHSPESAVAIGSLLFDLAIAWSSFHGLRRSSTLVCHPADLSGGETPPGS